MHRRSRRRLRHDRRLYNARRRIDRWLWSQLRRLGATVLQPPPPLYPPPVAVLPGRYRCACGRRRASLRFPGGG